MTKERAEALLDAELATGDSADMIEAFFMRHDLPFRYDAAIRRYTSSVMMDGRPTLFIYVYTDTDRKMTVSLVQEQKPQADAPRPMRRGRNLDEFLDFTRRPPNRPF